MRLLLDTQLLLWAAGEPHRLPDAARRAITDPTSDLFFSAASLWEVSIKASLGRTDFRVDPRGFRRALVENEYQELPITSRHAVDLDALPDVHKDPFDRIMLAQAIAEDLTFLTADRLLARYPGPVKLV